MSTLHLIGAGGHGRVVYDAALSSGRYRTVRWYDDAWKTAMRIGPIDDVLPIDDFINSPEATAFFVGIGAGKVRLKVLDDLTRAGKQAVSIFHALSFRSEYSKIGAGSVVMAGAVVQTGAALADGTIVNTAASVDHDCRLGRGVHIAPGAHLAGSVNIGDLTMIGAGAVVREGITIGAGVMIGAGAVVVEDVPDGVLAIGNPARIQRSLQE